MSCEKCTPEVQAMCCVCKGAKHEPAPIPEEGKWVKAKQIADISGLTHGVGWCAPQQGACKLTLNVKKGVIKEALVETLGYAFVDVIGTIAFYFGAIAVGEGFFAYNVEFTGFVIIVRLYRSKPVNAGNNVRGIFP